MKKTIVLTLIVCALLVLDNTLIPMIGIKNYYPSLLFTFVCIFSIINGPIDAAILGSVSGLLQDVYFFNGFGINAFTNLIICVLAAKLGENIFKEKALIPVGATFFLSALKGISLYCILYILGEFTSIPAILYTSIYNMVVAILMYRLVYKLSIKQYMKREWKF